MCLIVFSLRSHKKYPLVLAGNRDEFYKRPARPAKFWEDKPNLLAGKDIKGGGTWMGVTKNGKLGALTNYRDLKNIKEEAPTRGSIVTDYLTDSKPAPVFLETLDENAEDFNGFNVLAGTPDSFFHYSNETRNITEIESGIHGISNAVLNTPWPKVEKAEEDLRNALNSDHIDTEELFTLLKSKKTYPPEVLPDTGLPDHKEKEVSAAYIKTEDYGTRCSTIILMDHTGEITFMERTYDPKTEDITTEKHYNFQIDSEP